MIKSWSTTLAPLAHGNTETRKHGNKETRQHGNTETRKQGNKETRKQGNKEPLTTTLLTDLGIRLLLDEPFFGYLLAGLPKQWSTAVPDAGLAVIGQEAVLLVNEGWAADSDASALWLLKHELLHLLLRHLPLAGQAREFHLFSVAADVAVNRLLPPADRPPGAIGPEAWEDYPDALTACRAMEADWRRYLRGGGEPPLWRQPLSDLEASPASPLPRHRLWGPVVQSLPVTSRQLLDGQIGECIRQAAHRAAGRLPEGLRQWIHPPADGRPLVDWRRQLRLFAARSRRSRLRDTMRRPSKRYGMAPGLRLVRGARLLVAVDTSASVGAELLRQFLSEIHHLWRRQGAEVTIVECDTDIRRSYPYRGEWPAFIAGRGGTLFEAPIAWANDHIHPDGLIYFTDGKGPAPRIACRYPLLWVVAGTSGDHLPGQIVRIG